MSEGFHGPLTKWTPREDVTEKCSVCGRPMRLTCWHCKSVHICAEHGHVVWRDDESELNNLEVDTLCNRCGVPIHASVTLTEREV